MAIDEDAGPPIPEWVVTFGDMMSLLLTFFIMLVSFSEIKEEDKYQSMVESIRRRFGYQEALMSPMPGDFTPRNSSYEQMAMAGRAERFDDHNGGDKVEAPTGDYPQVRIIRPGTRTAIGSVFVFGEEQIELTDVQKHELDLLIEQMKGKPQKIEVRGHATMRPHEKGSGYQENWKLAYERAQNTMDYLVAHGIDQYRIRLAVAGPWEPFSTDGNPDTIWLNPRVEVFLLDEISEGPQPGASSPATTAPIATGPSAGALAPPPSSAQQADPAATTPPEIP